MNTCPNCGKVAGLHSSILQGCMCQYSMQAPPQPEQELMEWHEIVLNQKQFLEKMELLLAKTTAPPQPKQEPMATVESVATVVSESGNQEVTMSWWHEPALPVGTKLYTTPPQRTWVGLTDEDVHDCLKGLPTQSIAVYARSIEEKLKQKNGYAEEKNT